MNELVGVDDLPQGLKTLAFLARFGTTEAVPFQKVQTEQMGNRLDRGDR